MNLIALDLISLGVFVIGIACFVLVILRRRVDHILTNPAIDRTNTSEDYRVLLWILVIASVFLLVILSQIDATLAGMRAPGSPAIHISQLAGGLGDAPPGDNSERISAGVQTWKKHATTLTKDGLSYTRPLPIARLYILIDTILFLPIYAGVLCLLLGRGTNIIDSRREQLLTHPVLKDAFDAAYGIGFWLLALLVTADLLENSLQARVIAAAWREQMNPWWAFFLWSAAMLKWIFFFGTVLCVTVMGIATFKTSCPETKLEWRARLTNLRFEILLVSLFGVLLLVPEQAWDIPRRWNIWTGALGIAATALFSYFVWEFTARLIRVATSAAPPKVVPLRTLTRWGSVFLAIGVLLYFVGEHTAFALTPWGIAIPAAFVLMISLLSWVVERQVEAPATASFVSPETTTWTTGSSYGFHGPRRIAIATVVSSAIALVGALLWGSKFLEPLGGVLTVVGVVGVFCFFGSWWGPENPAPTPGAIDDWGARFVAALPLILLGLAVVRSSTGQLVYAPAVSGGSMWALFLVGLLLPPLAFGLVTRFTSTAVAAPWYRAWSLRFLAIVTGFVIVVGIPIDSSMWIFSEALGAVGILALFFLAASMVGAGLAFVGARMSPPTIFQVFNLKAIPIVSILLLWLVVATRIESGGYHDVRLVPEESTKATAEEGKNVSYEFNRWLVRNGLVRFTPTNTGDAPSEKPGKPLVIVAASGGGIRAAYWTANVLDCLFLADAEIEESCESKPPLTDDVRSDRLFAIGGISGGSLGAVSFNAYLLNHPDAEDPDRDWVKEGLDHDFLAANLAWELFVEAPRSLLRINPGMDRAEILERAWERAWKTPDGKDALSRHLLMESHALGRTPLLVLNGASVNDGCRFIASPLNSSPRGAPERCLSSTRFDEPTSESPEKPSVMAATQDLVDFLCSNQDVKLSTAALLSARFPFVSPSGRLEAQCADSKGDPPTTYVVDGGYFDTSAASPMVELWSSLEPLVNRYNRAPSTDACIVPFFIQVDNGYEVPDATLGDEKPGELTVPQKAAGQSRGAWLNHAKESAAIAFHQPLDAGDVQTFLHGVPFVDRYAHLYPRAHPGVQAPLGWVLSPSATEDLNNQLNSEFNLREIDEVRSWLTQDLTCTFPRTPKAES